MGQQRWRLCEQLLGICAQAAECAKWPVVCGHAACVSSLNPAQSSLHWPPTLVLTPCDLALLSSPTPSQPMPLPAAVIRSRLSHYRAALRTLTNSSAVLPSHPLQSHRLL